MPEENGNGYIGLYRELLDKPIWQNSTPEQKTILVTLLLMANHQEKEWEWKGEKFKARPGQFVTSLEKIQLKTGKGVSLQNVRTALKRFEKYEFLTDESTKTGRLITIVNWELYQVKKLRTNKATNRRLTDDQQTTNRQLTPNNNDKNDKNDKNVRSINDDDVNARDGKESLGGKSKPNDLGTSTINYAQQKWGRPLKEIECESILKACDDLLSQGSPESENLVMYAIEISSPPEIRVKIRYLDTIVRSWLDNGILTVEEAKREPDSRKEKGVKAHAVTEGDPEPWKSDPYLQGIYGK